MARGIAFISLFDRWHLIFLHGRWNISWPLLGTDASLLGNIQLRSLESDRRILAIRRGGPNANNRWIDLTEKLVQLINVPGEILHAIDEDDNRIQMSIDPWANSLRIQTWKIWGLTRRNVQNDWHWYNGSGSLHVTESWYSDNNKDS